MIWYQSAIDKHESVASFIAEEINQMHSTTSFCPHSPKRSMNWNRRTHCMIFNHKLVAVDASENGMCLKIRTSTCFHQGSRAPNSSAFERNYCRTALLTCLYFAFICSSYTKHTFMVEPKGVAPSEILLAKQTPLLHSDHGPIKISFTHQSCLQASSYD